MKEKMFRFLFLSMVAMMITSACGRTVRPAPNVTVQPPQATSAVKMRHQILFSTPSRQDVFEGFMVLFDDAFFVKAFAGPGVELFTIARDQDRRTEKLHIDGLKDRIDIERVGSDIRRVYLMACPERPEGSRQSCTVKGETIEERYDQSGNVVTRVFPSAHDIGLTVTYSDYFEAAGRTLPKRISLQWGHTQNKMVIVTLTAEPASADAKKVLQDLLATK